MARKKKHKKERSSREDQKRDDTDHGSSRDKNKYQHFPSDVVYKQKQVKGTSSPQLARKERPKKEIWKKSEGKTKQAKLTGHKVPLDRDHRALHVPWKCLPLGHGVHAMGTSSQTPSQPEASSKELLVKKSSAPEDPRQKLAEAAILPEGEKRKEVVKRRSSTQEDYPAAKQRTTDTRAAVSVVDKKLSQKRKELVARRSRDLGSEGLSKAKHISFTKAVNSKRSSSPVQNTAWSLTPKVSQHVSPKTQSRETQKERTGSMYGPTSGELTSHPRLPVTFKIPKKPSTSVTVPSPSAKAGLRHSGPAEVPSPRPVRSAAHKCSRFHEAQLVQPCPVRERSFSSTSSTSAWTEHASTECTEDFDNDQEMLLVEELHLARFDRRLTVNMEKSYGELTCMDVDTPEEGANTTLSAEQQVLLIVLDTNVLLSHLDFVKKMRSLGLGALGRPTLLIPWVVLQELDALKSGTLSPEVERKARPAMHYIYSCLKGQEPRLWGQSLQQASQAARGLVIENNDDRVLHCCLQYQVLYPEGSVILCTNDKNLCSKALLSGVKALSKADLVEQAEVNLTLLNDSCSLRTVLPPAGHNEQEPAKRMREEEEEGSRMKAPGMEWELGVCVSALESSLQGALSAVLEEEMKAAFGDLWTEIVYLKPPWTLQAVLQCFRKHWIAVFGSLIKRSLLSCVDTLCTSLCSGMEVQRGTVLTAVHAAEKLLTAFSHRSSYGGRVNAALFHLRGLKDKPRAQKTPVDYPSDSDSFMTEVVEDIARPPQACHQEVWALFESIWNNVCQASSAVLSALHCPPGSMGQSRPTSPSQDALSCLHGLSVTLTQLLEIFRRLVSVDSTLEDAQTLLTLIHTCEMAAMEPCITARDLFECLSLQEYREKLCVGGTQLMELKANLDRSAAAICGPGGST